MVDWHGDEFLPARKIIISGWILALWKRGRDARLCARGLCGLFHVVVRQGVGGVFAARNFWVGWFAVRTVALGRGVKLLVVKPLHRQRAVR